MVSLVLALLLGSISAIFAPHQDDFAVFKRTAAGEAATLLLETLTSSAGRGGCRDSSVPAIPAGTHRHGLFCPYRSCSCDCGLTVARSCCDPAALPCFPADSTCC